ncbi:hypothetical protein [Mucilaginibacter sp. OK283]|uniref:hypothetical protein n=1 Tax=Mucilaginibacter sp. OK283 TaxID=1881049 RepID=UPI0008BC084B|nr:hypothetical protein [Mucilaginibacter sp. OK283]SEO10871.1 YD repeat-containing protein [Mucilaginibacter sp. OK283]
MNNVFVNKLFKVKPFQFALIIFWFININGAIAQSPNQFQNMIGVGTTSPEVASLGKFGNIPVGYNTGTPNITIPIFEVKVGDIKLPISLDYHAGGIRVDEVSSCIGIGWALNAGGSVSRSLVGLPDESATGYLYSPLSTDVYNNEGIYSDYLYNVMEGLSDANPDVFAYGIEGQSAKFIIKQSDHSFIQFPLTNNKIENYAGTCYKITNQNGLAYIYEQKENTSFGTVNNVNLIPRYTSAWRLTKIVSSNQVDTVFITYDSVLGLGQHARSFSHTIGTSASTSYGTSGYGDVINSDSYVSQFVYNDESYVKEINWKGGKITFVNTADRSDYPSAMRAREINIYSKNLGTYSLLKKVKLNQSYFYYKPSNYSDPQDPDGVDPYRLRLDSVQFFDGNNVFKPQVYSMTYDNTPMAPRESFGQDQFGFNNGHFENTTLMPSQNVLFNVVGTGNSYYSFGSANRGFDAGYIKACSIQSMKYPTGGKTVYELEPHKYATQSNQIVQQLLESTSQGGLQSTNSVSFVLTADMLNLRYNVKISAYNYPDVSNRPTAVLTDQTTGQEVFRFTNMNASQAYTTGLNPVSNVTGPFLTVGHTYVLTTNIYTTNSNVSSVFDLFWDLQTNVAQVLQGGGLRVKTITNFDNNGSMINQKRYDYTDDGTGTLLTPQQYLGIFTTNTIFRRGNSQIIDGVPHGCMYSTGNPSVIYHSNSVIPASQLSGSPVLYGKVTEYDVSFTGELKNGKKVFGYPISVDQEVLANNSDIYGVQMISNVWRNGYLSSEDIYKSNSSSGYDLVESKRYNYVTARQSTQQMIRVQPRYTYSFDETSCNGFNSTAVYNDIILDSYDLPTSAIMLQSDSDAIYDNSGIQTGTTNTYSYDDATHLLPTQKTTLNSKQETLTNIMKYPHDLASGTNVYQTMVNRNMIAPYVKFQQLKNGTQLALANINYNDWFTNGKLLLPQTVDEQVLTNPIETRTKFNKYDSYGNILEQQKADGPALAYKWGYYNLYPVATVSNAASNEFYYEGFEENTGTNVVAGAAHTGARFYNGAYTVTWTRPNSRSYVISYWYRNGSGIWLYQPEVAYTGSSYALTGGTAYDDIRIYPLDAQMSTYTYAPLVGMTSSIDAKGLTTYYEYDAFQRLINIKDKDNNIVKHTDYHYAGQ